MPPGNKTEDTEKAEGYSSKEANLTIEQSFTPWELTRGHGTAQEELKQEMTTLRNLLMKVDVRETSLLENYGTQALS